MSPVSRLLAHGVLPLALFALAACQSDPAPAPTADSPVDLAAPALETPAAPAESKPPRHGQADISGSIMLAGQGTLDPRVADSPSDRTVFGSIGEVALVSLKTVASPSATNDVLAQVTGETARYEAFAVPTTDTWMNIPFALTASELFTVRMWNSAFEFTPPFFEAVTWTYDIETRPLDDVAEPNDDENAASLGDRVLGELLTLGAPASRSMYQLMDGSQLDREEWYRVVVPSLGGLHTTLDTANAVWGQWSYTARWYDNTGSQLAELVNFTGTNTSFDTADLAPGQYYLQMVGAPLSGLGTSVFYAPYTLQISHLPCTLPDITAVNLSETLARESATFTATNSGAPVTSWLWDFGGGAEVATSTAASPTVDLHYQPGTYTVTVTATNSCGSDVFSMDYDVIPKRLPLNINVFRSSTGQWPRLWWDLTDWSEESVRDWVERNHDIIYFDAGFQADRDRVTLTVWDNHPEWYNIDSNSEFNNMTHFMEATDGVLQYAVVNDQTYSGWGGVMFDNDVETDCDLDNLRRGCVSISSDQPYAREVFSHELGHVFSLPHIRTSSPPHTPANDNLMSYDRQGYYWLSHNITREAATGCMLSQLTLMDQFLVSHDWAAQYIDWEP